MPYCPQTRNLPPAVLEPFCKRQLITPSNQHHHVSLAIAGGKENLVLASKSHTCCLYVPVFKTYIFHGPPHAAWQFVLTSKKGTKVDQKVTISSTDRCSHDCFTGGTQQLLLTSSYSVLNLLER